MLNRLKSTFVFIIFPWEIEWDRLQMYVNGVKSQKRNKLLANAINRLINSVVLNLILDQRPLENLGRYSTHPSIWPFNAAVGKAAARSGQMGGLACLFLNGQLVDCILECLANRMFLYARQPFWRTRDHSLLPSQVLPIILIECLLHLLQHSGSQTFYRTPITLSTNWNLFKDTLRPTGVASERVHTLLMTYRH